MFIIYNIGYLHDQSDQVINISLCRKKNVFQKAMNRLGGVYGEVNIMKSQIRRLKGSSLDFLVDAGSAVYRFGPDGVEQVG